MAQAKRNNSTPPKKKSNAGFSSHGIAMLLAGVVIGSLGTIMWQGLQSRDSGVGSGIRKMIEDSKKQSMQQAKEEPVTEVVPQPQQTNYDFFTVLPEIEVVVSDEEALPEKISPPVVNTENSDEPKPEAPSSAYMLQAGSFNRPADADAQKAGLALLGLSSVIQKITIHGRGDFYRVRLGPFITHSEMVEADERLKQEGIKALRLKVSKAG